MDQGNLQLLKKLASKLHARYDQLWWQKPSFHNDWHVGVNQEASNLLFKAAELDNDPCLVNPSLKAWNLKNSANLTLTDLEKIFELTFAWHDLGNILGKTTGVLKMADLKIDTHDEHFSIVTSLLTQNEFGYLDHYQAHDSQQRSSQLLEIVMNWAQIEPSWQKLVLYLVQQSSWMYKDITEPFGLVWRVIDFCASGLWHPSQITLEVMVLTEWISEYPDKKINLEYDLNFCRNRIHEFFNNDQGSIESCLSILGKEIPILNNQFKNQQFLITDALGLLKNLN